MINLVAIMFFDSFAVYSSFTFVKLGIYGLKMLNVLGILFLLYRNTLKKYIAVLLILPFWWFFLDERSLGVSFQLLYSGVLPIITFMLLRDDDQRKVAWWFVKLLFYLCLIGLPIYFLINLVGIPPLFSFTKGEGVGGAGRTYDNYLFFYWTRSRVELRFSSVFDEPGVLGTIIPLIVYYYRNQLSKFQLIIFLLCGFLTMSLFFMLLIVPALYFSNIRKFSKRKIWVSTIFSVIIMVVAYLSLVFYARSTLNDRELALRVYYRFEWKNDWIVGVINNRDQFVRGFDEYYQQFNDPKTIEYYVGRGKNHMKEVFGGSTLSYRVLHLNKGAIIILYLLLLYAAIHPWRRHFMFSLISMIIIVLTFYQRPLLYSVNFVALLYAGIYLYQQIPLRSRKQLSKKE